MTKASKILFATAAFLTADFLSFASPFSRSSSSSFGLKAVNSSVRRKLRSESWQINGGVAAMVGAAVKNGGSGLTPAEAHAFATDTLNNKIPFSNGGKFRGAVYNTNKTINYSDDEIQAALGGLKNGLKVDAVGIPDAKKFIADFEKQNKYMAEHQFMFELARDDFKKLSDVIPYTTPEEVAIDLITIGKDPLIKKYYVSNNKVKSLVGNLDDRLTSIFTNLIEKRNMTLLAKPGEISTDAPEPVASKMTVKENLKRVPQTRGFVVFASLIDATLSMGGLKNFKTDVSLGKLKKLFAELRPLHKYAKGEYVNLATKATSQWERWQKVIKETISLDLSKEGVYDFFKMIENQSTLAATIYEVHEDRWKVSHHLTQGGHNGKWRMRDISFRNLKGFLKRPNGHRVKPGKEGEANKIEKEALEGFQEIARLYALGFGKKVEKRVFGEPLPVEEVENNKTTIAECPKCHSCEERECPKCEVCEEKECPKPEIFGGNKGATQPGQPSKEEIMKILDIFAL